MTNPFFSIITCIKAVGNHGFLEKSLESAKNQTFKDFEHVLILAKQSDKNSKIILDYVNSADYLVKCCYYPPKGISNAMNNGIFESSGVYLHFLHSDDFYSNPTSLERAHKILTENRVDWLLGTQVLYFPDQNRYEKQDFVDINEKTKMQIVKIWNSTAHNNMFIAKPVFDKLGVYREDYKISMDYQMWYRMITAGVSYKNVHDNFSTFTVHPKSFSSSPKNFPLMMKESIFARWDLRQGP